MMLFFWFVVLFVQNVTVAMYSDCIRHSKWKWLFRRSAVLQCGLVNKVFRRIDQFPLRPRICRTVGRIATRRLTDELGALILNLTSQILTSPGAVAIARHTGPHQTETFL